MVSNCLAALVYHTHRSAAIPCAQVMRITFVIHTTFTRQDERVREGSGQFAPLNALQREEPQGIQRYVLVPDALILAFANDPLAVGVYVAIARLVMAAKDSVPLAARDLAAWMGNDRDAHRAAIMRRISKLEERGWIVAIRTRATKNRLLPTWGCDQMGTVRPWLFNRPDSGRPAHVRGRRLPLALLDNYVGRLDPQPGQRHAVMSRYFTRPMLDLTDIGVYVIGLRAEVAPTPRLRHLGLHTEAGVTAPADGQSLMQLAAAGQLTTIVDDSLITVHLSYQGQVRFGVASTIAVANYTGVQEHPCGSISGSQAGSAGRSDDTDVMLTYPPQQNPQSAMGDDQISLITWEVGSDHKQINHDSSPDLLAIDGGASVAARDFSGVTVHPQCDCQQTHSHWPAGLTASLVIGHRTLNSGRQLQVGEWHELLMLQERYGADQLLIWQARASRVTSERSYGITPAYYHACAARAACDVYRPSTPPDARGTLAEPTGSHAISPLPLDPTCEALLATMGVRERRKLAAVPYALIASWQVALEHPGLEAQFTSPIGFAVAQMQRGNPPPPVAELDRWAARVHRRDDRYESWRYIEPVLVAGGIPTDEERLEARVRALAPPTADLEELCALAEALEAGVGDAEALAQLSFKTSAGSAAHEEHSCARR
jgi:hypothetical protein